MTPKKSAIEVRLAAANDMVDMLCSGDRRWLMHIPADPRTDPDLVIAASLADIPKLLARVAQLEDEAVEKVDGTSKEAT